MLKENFPNHCSWEEPEWNTRMSREYYEKKCKREQGRGDVDVSEYTKRRIYSKASPRSNSIEYHWMSNIDIEQVNLNLIKTVEHVYTYRPLQKRVMINSTKKACGWYGELKFQKYVEWNYNNYFKIVDHWWFEIETLDKYASGMAPHKFSFHMDSLHSLACLWTCEDGLWRRHPESHIASSFFKTCTLRGKIYFPE